MPAHRTISAIVPTIGRPASLGRLLDSLARQSRPVDEVVVADASGTTETRDLLAEEKWLQRGLRTRWLPVAPPSAVRQRVAAIAASQGEFLLLLDDDVELEPDCVQEMVTLLESDDVAAVSAHISNLRWPRPTRAWRAVLAMTGVGDGEWQGKVLGPLLRFGYDPLPATPQPMSWIGAGNTIVRASAYRHAGGFSTFFLDRSSMNEDVDLGLKLARQGRILFCPTARIAHYHAPEGRVSLSRAALDDLYNRFWVLHRTRGLSRLKAFAWVVTFYFVETAANTASLTFGRPPNGDWARFRGRTSAVMRLLKVLVTNAP